MDTNEFRIDKDKILIGEFKKNQINPGSAIPYVRNSAGTVVVDSNDSKVNTQRLVINLVNTRYKLQSFNNVLKTNFEEFLDPEIEVPDEEENTVQDLTSTVLDLQNQVKTRDEIINNLTKTVDNLSNTLSNVNTGSAAELIDVAALINEAINEAGDNKKPRIFSDGTLIRDRDNTEFYYIIEDGKKRWFEYNEELLNIVAKSLGKQKSVNGQMVPDLIDVSQNIIDDIPSGAPFVNFDLVKNVQTPAPPPLNLGDGIRLRARWIYTYGDKGKTADNPIIIETTNSTPTNDELTLALQVQVKSAEGIVNRIEIWDMNRNTNWFEGKRPVPIKDQWEGDNRYKDFSSVGQQDGIEYVKVVLKNTNLALNTGNAGSGIDYVNRYKPIQLSITDPTYDLTLTPKILNDNDDEVHEFDEVLYVRVKYIASMPNVVQKTEAEAINLLTAIGIPATNITISAETLLTTSLLLNGKIGQQTPAANSPIDSSNVSNLNVTLKRYFASTRTYTAATIRLSDNFDFISNTKENQLKSLVRRLKSVGLTNILVKPGNGIIRSSYPSYFIYTDHLKVDRLLDKTFNRITTGGTYLYTDPMYVIVEVDNNAFSSSIPTKRYSQLTTDQIIDEINNRIRLMF